MEAESGLSLVDRTTEQIIMGWCCGDMLIASLQASAEQQSLTIRKNNDFTMKEIPLFRRERISMHHKPLEVSYRPPERSVARNASCLFKTRELLLPEFILLPRKTEQRSGFQGS